MAGMPAFNINPLEIDLNPVTIITSIRAFYPKWQSMIFLVASGVLFCLSTYFKNHMDLETRYFVDLFLASFVLTLLPRRIVTMRLRIVARLGEWGFVIFKGIFTVAFFTLFHWLGKKLLNDKDIFISLSCVLFFFHLLALRVIHEITDDVGLAQGVLIAGYTLLIAEYPTLLHITGLSAALTFFLAILNTPQPPYQAPHEEIDNDLADQPPYSDEDLEAGHADPPAIAPVIPLEPKVYEGNWAEASTSRWKLAQTTEMKCKQI